VAALARRAGSLSASGAVAATLVGGASAAAGWAWAALLIGWFVASSALTRLGAATKARRTAATLPHAGPRTALQVWANGGVFALAALGAQLTGDARFAAAAVGALAAAAADTWATEIGTLLGGAPRSIVTGAAVEPGLSGGITVAGTLGGAVGALAVALPGTMLLGGGFTLLWPLAAAGVLGGLGDSLLGATVQAKRRCPRCQRWTERATHDCGVATEPGRGWRWMTNDTVNLVATFIGASAATWLVLPLLPAVP
jgi:uncharacterized protein (TIGR00297 family)